MPTKFLRRFTLLIVVVIWGALSLTACSEKPQKPNKQKPDYNIDWPMVTEIFVQNGNTGEQFFFTNQSDISYIIDYLEAFTYDTATRKSDEPSDGWGYRVVIIVGNKQDTSNWNSFEFGNGWIEVDHVIYESEESYFKPWIDLFK